MTACETNLLTKMMTHDAIPSRAYRSANGAEHARRIRMATNSDRAMGQDGSSVVAADQRSDVSDATGECVFDQQQPLCGGMRDRECFCARSAGWMGSKAPDVVEWPTGRRTGHLARHALDATSWATGGNAMTGIHSGWLGLLDRLFVCPDCEGRGKREHGIWPKIEFKVSEFAEIVDETAADYVPPRVEFRKCDTCRGTGRD